jgi:hypothetical protein
MQAAGTEMIESTGCTEYREIHLVLYHLSISLVSLMRLEIILQKASDIT